MSYPGPAPLYPPADRYVEAFGEAQLRHWLARRTIGGIQAPLSVCVQTADKYTTTSPFDPSVRKTLTEKSYLAKELELILELLPKRDRAALRVADDRIGDVLGIGPGAFGRLGPICYQNHTRIEDYRGALEQNRLPVWRGIELTADDLVRRTVMETLARHGRVSIEGIEIGHVVDFRRYFATELEELAALQREGLVTVGEEWIVLADEGRRQVARVCEVFNRYLRVEREHAALTRVL